MSRLIRTSLPVHTSKLIPFVVPDVKTKLQTKQDKLKCNYDRSTVRKDVDFNVSDKVLVQNPISKYWETGLVLNTCEEPRSYIVQTNSSKLRRNVKFLKPNQTEANVTLSLLPAYTLYHTSSPQSKPVVNIPIIQNGGNVREVPLRRSARIASKK